MLKLEQLNDQTFDDIVETAVKGIARFDTEWNNLQAADPGMTLVDLFAWLKAIQHEYMSVIVPESQRRFLALLDIRQRRPRGARTLLELSGARADTPIPAQTKWMAGEMAFENREGATAFAASLTGVCFRGRGESICITPEQLDGNRMFPVFPGLGPEPDREPDGALVLTFDRPIPPNRTFSLYCGVAGGQRRAPVGDAPFFPLADVAWEIWTDGGWQPAELLRDDTRAFLFSGLITLRHSGEMCPGEEGYALRARLVRDDYDLPPQINDLRFNIIEVYQQDTLVRRDVFHQQDALVLSSDLGLHGDHRVFLEEDGQWRETEDFRVDTSAPGQAVIRLPEAAAGAMVLSWDRRLLRGVTLGSGTGFSGQQLPFGEKDVEPDSLSLLVGRRTGAGDRFQVWERQDDLYASGPYDRHFVLDEQHGTLRFGDHMQGVIPPKGTDNILLCGCRTCRGKASDIKAGRISAPRTADPALLALGVRQIVPAAGGEDGETFEETVARAGEALRSGRRAVTEADYLAAVRAVPGIIVENCRVLTGFDGPEDSRITVVVQGAGRAERTPRASYEQNIRAALDRCRMLNAQIHVVWPRIVRLAVRCRIAAAPYYHDAEQLVRRRIEDFVAGLNRSFGSILSYGELYCAVDLLECVRRIESLSVEPIGDYITKTRADDIVVPPNSIYEIERFELSSTGSL